MFFDDKKFIGNKIKQYRNVRHVTQAQLSEIANISEKHLSKIETGVYYPSVPVFFNICEKLRIPLSEFGIDIEEHSQNKNKLCKYIFSLNETELQFLQEFVQSTFGSYSIKKKK